MLHQRMLGTIRMIAILASVFVSVGLVSATTVAAAPPCNAFVVNTTGLSASEVYYAQLAAERFMVREFCSVKPTANLSASEVYYAQRFMQAQHDYGIASTESRLNASEVYYAQKAFRFMPLEARKGMAELPQ